VTAPTDTNRPLERRDLAGFLITHAGMRQEFGLLTEVARAPRDAAHAKLIEDQVALVADTLHKHHTAEDDAIFAMLDERVPEIRDEIARLEDEHAAIDPLLQRVTDTTIPLPDRAGTMAELHVLINAHLDREERVAVPRIYTDITRAEWDALADRAMKETNRRRLPVVFGWVASAASDEHRAVALANVPAIPRVLFKLFWWPAYQRRYAALYGSRVATPAVWTVDEEVAA